MSPAPIHHPRGVTVIELSVVIAMILSITSGLFYSASYYRDSANQASCVVQIEAMQKAVRTHQNFNALTPGTLIEKSDLVGTGKAIPEELFCPQSGGQYIFLDIIPASGVPFARCQDFGNAPDKPHRVTDTTAW